MLSHLKFDFSTVKKKQRKAMEELEWQKKRFCNFIDDHAPACVHVEAAKKHLHQAIMQCNAAICFYWDENPPK